MSLRYRILSNSVASFPRRFINVESVLGLQRHVPAGGTGGIGAQMKNFLHDFASYGISTLEIYIDK